MIIDCIFNLSNCLKKYHGEHEKIMFFTFFQLKESVYANVLSAGEYFANNILPYLKAAANKIKVRLNMDNAKSCNSIIKIEKMNELHIEPVPHPPYSQDISPNDFFFMVI